MNTREQQGQRQKAENKVDKFLTFPAALKLLSVQEVTHASLYGLMQNQ